MFGQEVIPGKETEVTRSPFRGPSLSTLAVVVITGYVTQHSSLAPTLNGLINKQSNRKCSNDKCDAGLGETGTAGGRPHAATHGKNSQAGRARKGRIPLTVTKSFLCGHCNIESNRV